MRDAADSLVLEKELVIPAGEHGSVTVKQGQVVRIIALEGEQCLDAVFLNANDYRERFHTPSTARRCFRGRRGRDRC
jgi:uncharacterized protein YcgI (DUF1989 family)